MRRVSLFVYLAFGVAMLSASGQSPATQQPTFRAATEVVQIDVTVLDKDRRPIRDLTKADFTILEDGKPQSIVAFSPIDVPDPAPSLAALPAGMRWTRDVAPDVQTNALPQEGRIFVLFLDDAMMPADPKIIEEAKNAARSVVNHLGPNDQMAIAFSDNGSASQTFTMDRVKLLAAVDQLRVGRARWAMGWDTAPDAALVNANCPYAKPLPICPLPFGFLDLHPTDDSDDAVHQASFETLRSIADGLMAIEHRRKTVVYVGPGVPVNFGDTSPILASGTGKGMTAHEQNRRLASEIPELFRQMQRADIAVYTIDPSGLGGMEFYVAGHLASVGALHWPKTSPIDLAGSPTPGTVPMTLDLAHFVSQLSLDFLQMTADNTGGRAIVNTNDLEPGIEEMFRETGSYYSIGYQATDPGTGRFHRLSVKVDRPGVEVRSRSAYYATDAKAEKKLAAASPVARAIAGVLPDAGLPMEVTLAPFASSTTAGATVAIMLGVSQPAPHQRTGGTVDVETKAFTPDGLARGDQSQTAHMTLLPAGADGTASYELLSRIDLKPGRYQLRIGAHTSIGDLRGSVFADVEIPDFAKAPVSLSGVLLEAKPAPFAAPKDALAALVPIVPTAARSFDQRDHASAFVRAYQGASGPIVPVSLATTILNDKGETMLSRMDEISAASFDAKSRSADEHVTLPLDKLASGDYLLTIATTEDATTVRRDVRFRVKQPVPAERAAVTPSDTPIAPGPSAGSIPESSSKSSSVAALLARAAQYLEDYDKQHLSMLTAEEHYVQTVWSVTDEGGPRRRRGGGRGEWRWRWRWW